MRHGCYSNNLKGNCGTLHLGGRLGLGMIVSGSIPQSSCNTEPSCKYFLAKGNNHIDQFVCISRLVISVHYKN